jgi:hypothetical protein
MVVGVQQIAVHDNATCQSTLIYAYPDYVNSTVAITPGKGNIHFPAGSLIIKNFGPYGAVQKATLRLVDSAGNILYEETAYLDVNQTLSNSKPIYLDMPTQNVNLNLVAGEYMDSTFYAEDIIPFTLKPLGTYTLTVNSSPVSAQFQKNSATYTTPHSQQVPAGSTVTVTVAAYTSDAAGTAYKFDHWEDGSTDPTRIITVNANTTVTAYYVQTTQTYTLTISVEPAEGGTTNPPPGQHTYYEGTTVTVTATPASGYKFDHWLLDGEARTENPITITMDRNHTLTAYFATIPTYTLTVVIQPPDGGTVTLNPPTGPYPEGTIVTATATPATGYKFDHWELDTQVRAENPTTITMDKNYTLTAYFTQVPIHRLTIAVSDPSMGTTNPAPGTYTYSEGSTVTVQAIPNTGYRFKNWTLDTTSSTENPITVYMDKDYTLTAYFEAAPAPQYATLTGTVTGLFGKPVSGAAISLNNQYRTATDANGKYTIQNITPGTYALTASHPLYETKIITVSLPQPTTYTVDITLQFKRIYIVAGAGALSAIIAAISWAVRK